MLLIIWATCLTSKQSPASESLPQSVDLEQLVEFIRQAFVVSLWHTRCCCTSMRGGCCYGEESKSGIARCRFGSAKGECEHRKPDRSEGRRGSRPCCFWL